ncbi:MAG: NAD(P)-dependent glycerol-3-phosphate dehydrogenase [Candidatus Cloacimonetes bacterium]|nr:NAD(P)-dependent glycerol-3-phosphate dehydrogenase [Candidatus Cloacimonadota bacterium]
MLISIIGGGGWGLALAKLLHNNGHKILVWEYNARYLATLRDTNANDLLLKGIVLPTGISYTSSFADLQSFTPEIIIIATPVQFIRNTLRQTDPTLWTSANLLAVISVSKGIEETSLKTVDAILQDELPAAIWNKICALSGPSHAEEVARELPTTVVIAGSDDALLQKLQVIFSNSYFRAYRSSDMVGVEIGGAVKNIIAIAAGIVLGLGFGDNTIGALLTRGIVEISRLGIAMNAKPETFLGLSGIGDLITTATSPHSRNRYVGVEIGKGRKLKDILAEMNMVAEGVATTRSVYHLAQQLQVDMPIVTQVYQALYMDKNPQEAIIELMTRELKAE